MKMPAANGKHSADAQPDVAQGAQRTKEQKIKCKYNLTNGRNFCYIFNNYKDMQARKPDSEVPKIAINNIFPDKNTVKKRTYPFISEVHVAIRSDLDRNSMAYKLYEWLQSENAKHTITECGFIPK